MSHAGVTREGEVSDGSHAALGRLCDTSEEEYLFNPATHM